MTGGGIIAAGVGKCADYADQIPTGRTCTDVTYLAPSPASRTRSRRSTSLGSNTLCPVEGEEACLIAPGSPYSGYECIDVSCLHLEESIMAELFWQKLTDIDHCGACHRPCSLQQKAGVLFSGCDAGRCETCK